MNTITITQCPVTRRHTVTLRNRFCVLRTFTSDRNRADKYADRVARRFDAEVVDKRKTK